MPKEINKEEVCVVLDWMEKNNASFNQTALHFDKNPKTISAWAKKFDVEELRADFKIISEIGETTTTVEKKQPVEVRKLGEESLISIAKTTLNISKKVEEYIDNLCTKSAKDLKAWEVHVLRNFHQLYLPHIIPDETKTTETKRGITQELINAQVAMANKLNKENKKYD